MAPVVFCAYVILTYAVKICYFVTRVLHKISHVDGCRCILQYKFAENPGKLDFNLKQLVCTYPKPCFRESLEFFESESLQKVSTLDKTLSLPHHKLGWVGTPIPFHWDGLEMSWISVYPSTWPFWDTSIPQLEQTKSGKPQEHVMGQGVSCNPATLLKWSLLFI